MAQRRVKLTILCEDSQHEAFLRRFFESAGWHQRQLRVKKSPLGRGAAEQWVRALLPRELATLRRSHVATCLVVMVDADRFGAATRLDAFRECCENEGVEPRTPVDPVLFLVPTWNIETWIAYLEGATVDESFKDYPKLKRARDCAGAVKVLRSMCDQQALREKAPSSLVMACAEYRAWTSRADRSTD